MSSDFSTGSHELDALLEELRVGDNVVWYTQEPEDYAPFVRLLVQHLASGQHPLVYVRSSGAFDEMVRLARTLHILDLAALAAQGDLHAALQAAVARIGLRVYYLFEPLATLSPWLAGEDEQLAFFLFYCPLLFRQESIAYWSLGKGEYRASTIAAIKDCTQVFLSVDRQDGERVVTPVRVWGRYAELMFRPHRISLAGDGLRVYPLPAGPSDQHDYTLALAEKNRELAEIRDALGRSNQSLLERNRQLAVLNDQLSEQGRLFQSLRVNLDHLLALLRAGQAIGSTLALEQVRQAVVAAGLRLFAADPGETVCRLVVQGPEEAQAAEVVEARAPQGVAATEERWRGWIDDPAVAPLRAQVRQGPGALSSLLGWADPAAPASVAIAPVTTRAGALGTLEVYADDARLDDAEQRTLLSYLASEAGIALDNAYLHRELETQGKQLRSFVENVITSEEQESRRLALDLHDGLVQLIVASYQHLQTAQAWRGRDPALEEREISQGVQLLRRAIYESRRLIGQLRPAGLDDFGLVQALRLLVAQLAADAEWQLTLQVDPRWEPLPVALEAAIFRIVQEATSNARKYAKAAQVQIQLGVQGEELSVCIRDWGIGFDPAELPTTRKDGLHIGLIGIRERAHLWGGRSIIASQPGKGTTIEVRIPRSSAAGRNGGREGDG